MSWSFRVMGKPDAVVRALEEESGKLTGQSKIEFDEALPHLIGLVKQNFNQQGSIPTIKIDANGSGSSKDGVQFCRSCTARIESEFIRIVT